MIPTDRKNISHKRWNENSRLIAHITVLTKSYAPLEFDRYLKLLIRSFSCMNVVINADCRHQLGINSM